MNTSKIREGCFLHIGVQILIPYFHVPLPLCSSYLLDMLCVRQLMVNPLYFKCGRKPIAQSGSEMNSLVNLPFILCWFSDIQFAESEVHLSIFLH